MIGKLPITNNNFFKKDPCSKVRNTKKNICIWTWVGIGFYIRPVWRTTYCLWYSIWVIGNWQAIAREFCLDFHQKKPYINIDCNDFHYDLFRVPTSSFKGSVFFGCFLIKKIYYTDICLFIVSQAAKLIISFVFRTGFLSLGAGFLIDFR